MTKVALLIALLLSTACATAEQVDAKVLVLTPTTAPAELVREAAARWTAATGVEIVVADAGGIPVSLEENTFGPLGQNCAVTESTGAGVTLDIQVDGTPPVNSCRPLLDTLTHEIGHALCRLYDPRAPAGCHSSSGVMHSNHNAELLIDESTLSTMCGSVPCTAFAPEVAQ
jgi:hypothetical protein